MKNLVIFTITAILIINCNTSENNKIHNYTNSQQLSVEHKSLIEAIQNAIIPIYKDWVLFENGTYIIFDNIDTIKEIGYHAIELLKLKSVSLEQVQSGNFSITELEKTQGWSVFTDDYGIYTYVNPLEINEQSTSSVILNKAIENRIKDQNENKIICISSKNGLTF